MSVMTFDPNVSPLGDRRNRSVPCKHLGCRTRTWAIDRLCPAHRPLKPCCICNHVPTPDGDPCSVCANRGQS